MGLTRTEQWTLIVVVALIAGGFATQKYFADPKDRVVWVEAGDSWNPVGQNAERSDRDTSSPGTTLPPEKTDSRTGNLTDPTPSVPPESPEVTDSSRGEASDDPLAIDLNTANRDELILLPGIGPVKAEAILAYRAEHGRFGTIEQLIEVKGIGPKTLQGLNGLVRAASDHTALAADKPPGTPSAGYPSYTTDDAKVTQYPIDLNRASSEELQTLSGIGPVLADRIIQSRLKSPYRSVDELRRVRGIGPKTLEGLRVSVVVR